VTEREELARIIDREAFASHVYYDAAYRELKEAEFAQRRFAALDKADQWLSRPSPVDELVAASRILIRDIWQSASGDWHITGGDPESAVTNLQNAITAYDKAKGKVQ
jgi:hypothetical protein